MAIRMVTFGDSVTWGQGLLPAEKFSSLVAAELGFALEETALVAHSGAIIGTLAVDQPDPHLHGEVPHPFPTIREQVQRYDAPDSVTRIIINGGINDVGATTILNPFTSVDKLQHLTASACGSDMEGLLRLLLARFRNPELQIVVTGYYPILSKESLRSERSILEAFAFLQLLGIAPTLPAGVLISEVPEGISAAFAQRFNILHNIVTLAETFWTGSTPSLQQAIRNVNAGLATPQVSFADPVFQEQNAALASQPWLWGVDFDLELSPQDPVAADRKGFCATDEPNLLRRFTCDRASAGHPNVTGAQQFAAAILEQWRLHA